MSFTGKTFGSRAGNCGMRYSTLLNGQSFALFTRGAPALGALLAWSALALAEPPASPPPPSTAPLSPEAQDVLQDMLHFDRLRSVTATSTLRALPKNSSGGDLNWNRTDKNDGSTALSVKKTLPTTWDAKVGADFGLGPAPNASYAPLPTVQDRNSGTAWANVAVPGIASIDARVDPAKDQSKLGTTFSKSLPLGRDYLVTLQNSYAVTETLGGAPAAPAIGSPPTAAPPTQVWSTDRMVKFNFLTTGTSLAAGTTTSTIDNITRNKLSAEQKLFDKLNITTSVTESTAGRPAEKSISAGIKWQW